MDLKCPLSKCGITFFTADSYCKHVNRHTPTSEVERCIQFCCPVCELESRKSFNSVGLLKKHLKKVHPQLSNSPYIDESAPSKMIKLPTSMLSQEIEESRSHKNLEASDHVYEDEQHEIVNPVTFSKGFEKSSFNADDEVFRLYSTLFSKTNMANKTVESIIDSFSIFFMGSLEFLERNIKCCPGSDAAYHAFQKASFEITNALQSFNTKTKFETGLKRRNVYSEPSHFLIREQTVEKLGEFEEEASHGVIMSIKHQIKTFLQMPNVFREIMNNQNRPVVEGQYTNLIDGELWKKIKTKFEGKKVVPIYLYNDDFQPDSPLSPHSKYTKLGAYYYSFPTLPDHLATNLKNIFLAALVKVSDIGQNEVVSQEYDPSMFALFEVLAELEETGVSVDVDGNLETVHIVLPQFLGDNLGLNTALGFPRGFTAKFLCRMCLLPKDLREQTTMEIKELLRNKRNFEECLQGSSSSIDERKGIRFNCVLNYLESFKVYENFSVDIMHDVFLGVFKIDISVILDHYLKNEVFTLNELNDVKRSFDYGKKNIGNKTVDILETHIGSTHKTENLRMNAKEVWTLVEFLPLILMSLVENHGSCQVFAFSLKMTEVLDSITKSSYTEDDILEMENRISEHHKIFLNLFKTTNTPQYLTPKFHNMLHYGTCVSLTGPLKKTMVFRYEQKHQEPKQYARACYSRKNLPLSICRKFSLEAASHFLDKRNMFSLITDFKFKTNTQKLGSYSCDVTKPMKYLKYKAVLYELGDLVFHENEAFVIKEIVQECDKEEIYLYSQKVNYELIDQLGFFKMSSETSTFQIIRISDLRYAPVNLHNVSNNCYFKIKYF